MKKLRVHTNKMKIKKEKGNIYNFGLGFLKMFMALDVICVHCLNYKSCVFSKNIIERLYCKSKRKVHVPSFMIMSFYFMQNSLISLKFKVLFQRIIRLGIPYFGWPIIVYAFNNYFISKLFKVYEKYSLNQLKIQLLWGNLYMIQYWFQWDLIVITVLFFSIIFIFRKNHLFFLQLLAIASYVAIYSGYNFKIYKTLRQECLGRFSELIPYASTGFTLGTYKIFSHLNKHRIKTIVFSFLIFNLVEDYSIFLNLKEVAYSDIKYNVRSVSLIFLFSVFPSEYIKNKMLQNILKLITNYTAGVFYLHFTVYIYFKNIISSIGKNTFMGCVQIYLVCYIICFISMKLVGKTILKNLFS